MNCPPAVFPDQYNLRTFWKRAYSFLKGRPLTHDKKTIKLPIKYNTRMLYNNSLKVQYFFEIYVIIDSPICTCITYVNYRKLVDCKALGEMKNGHRLKCKETGKMVKEN